ncbi:MAG: D-alanyl-D-alanine carboxypeptidase [Candidatus Levybacteria bacterium]|nr:D-alanyl-D-alanine carboxypeptidase [Candidatus Levybacteria bacterium]
MKDILRSVDHAVLNFTKPNIFLIPLFVVVLLIMISVYDIYIQQVLLNNQILPIPITTKVNSYPLLKNTNPPEISAKAAIIMDKDSSVVLFSKNPNLRFSPASTTKIMTALTALEYFDLTDILTVKSTGIEGSVIGLSEGERMTFGDLLYAMLLPSANDAAFVIAQNFPGGEKAFIDKMNENTRRLHLYNMHFEDPAGLLDYEDYASPIDLARLASISLDNKTLSQIVATKRKIISDIDGVNIYDISNLNKLLGAYGVNGVKTGFTDEAGGVLITSKVEKDHTLIIVVLRSDDRFSDTLRLIDFISGNINYLTIRP